jgi:hypothetical protein
LRLSSMGPPRAAASVALAVCVVSGCSGSASKGAVKAESSNTQTPRPSESAAACAVVGKVNDQEVVTVGDFRTWGPVPKNFVEYPGYAAKDKLAICLQPDGTVTGIFLRDGHREVLWHQSPAERIIRPV